MHPKDSYLRVHIVWLELSCRHQSQLLSSVSGMLAQLGALVNNGAVTQSRCLSTERAPPLYRGLVENSLCVQDGPVFSRGSTFITIK